MDDLTHGGRDGGAVVAGGSPLNVVIAGVARAGRAMRRPAILRLAAVALVSLIGAAALLALTALSLLRAAPEWWRTLDSTNAATVALAEQVERGVVNSMHRIRENERTWTVRVTPEQANAWLNARMPKWVSHRYSGWPESLAEVQAGFAEGDVMIGARVRGPGGDQIVAATVRPRVDESGALWLELSGARAGRLDLPYGWTVSRLRGWLPADVLEREGARRFLAALRGEGPVFDDASFELEDGRRVRLLDVRPAEGELLLTCRTERPSQH